MARLRRNCNCTERVKPGNQRSRKITHANKIESLLTITVTRDHAGVLISLNGRLTIDSSPELRERLLALMRGEPLQNLTIDLADVPYIDISGVATLLEALKVARIRKISLQLTGLQDRPRYLLEVTGLFSLFEPSGHTIAPSIQKA